MKRQKIRFRFYMILYSLIAIIAVAGLAINIQTIPINENIQKLSAQVKKLRDENQELKLKVLSATRLELVDQMATDQLHMSPPKQVIYIQQKDKPNVFHHAAP